ncbi:MAG: hypothetical protein ACTSXP_14940 [Promethearchaeota archaeon]
MSKEERVIVGYCKRCKIYTICQDEGKVCRCEFCNDDVQLLQICETCEFINEREGMDFKIKARHLLYSRKEIIIIIMMMPIGIALTFGELPPEISAIKTPFEVFLWRILGTLVYWTMNFILLGSAVGYFVGIVRVMLLISRERRDFAIFHFSERLKDEEESNIKNLFRKKPVVFSEFERVMRVIGMLLYDVCLRLLFIGIAMSIMLMVFWTLIGIPIITTILLSIVILIVVLMLFMIPQFKVHELLADVKDRLKFGFKRIFDNVTLEYLTVIKNNKQFEPTGSWDSKADIREDLGILREINDDISNVSTWTFNFPAVFKLIGAGITPIILAIIQALLAL